MKVLKLKCTSNVYFMKGLSIMELNIFHLNAKELLRGFNSESVALLCHKFNWDKITTSGTCTTFYPPSSESCSTCGYIWQYKNGCELFMSVFSYVCFLQNRVILQG